MKNYIQKKGRNLGVLALFLVCFLLPVKALAADEADFTKLEYSTDTEYVVVNDNEPYFSDEDKKSTEAFEEYSDLDDLGRCGVAYANICKELMPTEKRGEIGSVKPTGWQTVKYDSVDGKYLYNRCHLIGFQLAGENANEKNLITGTRFMNVDGMLPFENLVDDYVDETGNHVLYRVTPDFRDDNLVANGVEIEAWSVEDDGDGVCFNVYCPNVQPGITIDYATGNSSEDSSYAASDDSDSSKTSAATAAESKAASSSESTYICNENTKKFHLPSCSYVNRMSEKNKKSFTGTRDELISEGYEACEKCNP